MPGIAFFVMVVIVAIILFVVLNPSSKLMREKTVKDEKLSNLLSMIRSSIDDEGITDADFRAGTKMLFNLTEGQSIPKSQTVRVVILAAGQEVVDKKADPVPDTPTETEEKEEVKPNEDSSGSDNK